MATFSSVSSQHVLQAIAEYDERGADDFRALYGFAPSDDYTLVHEGRTYDARAVLGVAHKHATGRLAPSEEVDNGMVAAVGILRRRGFEMTEPASARVAAPAVRTRAPRAPRTTAPRTPTARSMAAAREERVVICPTCSMTLPATGVCDYCG